MKSPYVLDKDIVSIVTLESTGKQFLGMLHGYTLEQSMLAFTSQLSFENSPPIWMGWTTLKPVVITRVR